MVARGLGIGKAKNSPAGKGARELFRLMTHFPDWVEPMAATLTQERFTGSAWIFERKLDGIRLLAFKNGTEIRLLSRNRLPQHLPTIREAIAGLPVRDVILDGEVTWGAASIDYHVFDIMWLE